MQKLKPSEEEFLNVDDTQSVVSSFSEMIERKNFNINLKNIQQVNNLLDERLPKNDSINAEEMYS